MVENNGEGNGEETEETLLTMAIDATLLALWQQTSRTGKVKTILARSAGAIHFYPSEADALSKAALTGLPGEDPRSGINVAVKFSERFARNIPA